MSDLVIDHGGPWWLSPNVRAVRVTSPDDPSPGAIAPVAGQPYFMKANIRDAGPSRVENAQIDFWWANPSPAITRSNADPGRIGVRDARSRGRRARSSARSPGPSVWQYFVVAQDTNLATPDLSPEQAAQYIGGMVRTHQLAIDFSGGTCPLVPDGDVHVISSLGG